jgi:hypothetical protein
MLLRRSRRRRRTGAADRPPPTPSPLSCRRYRRLHSLLQGVFVPVTQMGRWDFLYYCDALAQALRLASLEIFYCDASAPGAVCQMVTVSTGGAPITETVYEYVSGTLLGMPYSRHWEALGWALFIIAFFRCASILSYARINHTKR